MRGSLLRIHKLGAAASELFQRLSQSFESRQPSAAMQALRLKADGEQQKAIRLEQLLKDRERELTQLSAVLANLDDGIIVLDLDGQPILLNAAAQLLLGGSEVLPPPLEAWVEEFRPVEQIEAEMALLGRAQKLAWKNRTLGTQIAAIADAQGERFGTLIVLRDLTKEERAEKLKDQIITSISHELKTPMNVLRIASEVLLSQPDDAPVNRKMLEKLSRNVDLLDRMIIELLDVSEMSSGSFRIEKQPVHLPDVLWDVVYSFEADLKRAKLDVQLMVRDVEHLMIQGDAARLKWAFGHVLRNAIAYTEAGGHLVVNARLADNGRQIRLQFKDSGVGIGVNDMQSIFDLFYRGEARSPSGKRLDPRGLGQGLFIARRVMEAHDGTIRADSVVQQGTTFTVTLPAAAALPSSVPS
jgi:signal transduction histidine kinase